MPAPAARERGILFSAPMVRALLAGAKSQTRRVVKPANVAGARRDGAASRCCPFSVDERLWVREGWRVAAALDALPPSGFAPCPVRYTADDAVIAHGDGDAAADGRVRAGIHMPRWASRIALRVAAVRAEPLGACTAADAMAEGILAVDGGWQGAAGLPVRDDAVLAYRDLWERLHGAGAWDADPWVWVVDLVRA